MIERWLRCNARHDVPEAGIVLGILALTEHDGRPYVALGTYDQTTAVRDTAQLTVGEQTQVGSTLVRVEEIRLDERAAVRVSIQRPDDRQAGAARVRVVLVTVAVLLVVLLAGWGYRTWRYAQTPPPMSAAAVSAGAVRLTYPLGGEYSLPPPTTEVDVAGAGQAILSLMVVHTEDDGVFADITVRPPGGDFRTVDLRLNEPVQVGNVTVRLVAVYDMPNDSHDAADVVVTATD